ncbi:uncharacterized protein PGTG_22180 [Puccinia graminis f. sp. tritici CRL 75-36-700-3]|uniref:Uncharacterized protein n=1 Tax=Puccinia graminis f. sp. tritici (strain CRL 75-36-700-3 / race SCCL) TaxID=418459 RepID=H6QTV0_PUCGT|nr:uncharacterized protein PGTG_22180 [Puccinia graminis f. sp. tritici CRL 75-36-700-3]EHS64356.1 hypothetical protein PGTG_22180 [Puccinia graminis f. sp. tritici CRL 75-36-700-3]
MSFHGSIPRSSGGANEEASNTADRESAVAPKRSTHGVELRQWPESKTAGGCSTVGTARKQLMKLGFFRADVFAETRLQSLRLLAQSRLQKLLKS